VGPDDGGKVSDKRGGRCIHVLWQPWFGRKITWIRGGFHRPVKEAYGNIARLSPRICQEKSPRYETDITRKEQDQVPASRRPAPERRRHAHRRRVYQHRVPE